jgi:hypothetical protein
LNQQLQVLAGAHSIAVSWESPDQLYAGGEHGFYASTDCGQSWSAIPVTLPPWVTSRPEALGPVSPVVAAPQDRIYLGRLPYTSGMLVSSDQGMTWLSARGQHVSALAASPVTTDVLYAVLVRPNFGAQGLYRSDDSGFTWQLQDASFRQRVLAADPLEANVLYFGPVGCAVVELAPCYGLARSTDGGGSSHVLAQLPSPPIALTTGASTSRFWLSTEDGELYESPDRGMTWEVAARVPSGSRIVSLSVSPFDPALVFAVTDEAELWVFRRE